MTLTSFTLTQKRPRGRRKEPAYSSRCVMENKGTNVGAVSNHTYQGIAYLLLLTQARF